MKTVHKAVGAIIKWFDNEPWLLVFDHPFAGTQLVKGTVDEGESVQNAVVREILEESGLVVDSPGPLIGQWERIVAGGQHEDGPLERNLWHVFLVRAPTGCPLRWEHAASGSPAEEGLTFMFRWVRVTNNLTAELHPLFETVANMIVEHLDKPKRSEADNFK